jgi:galactonate dehydratase
MHITAVKTFTPGSFVYVKIETDAGLYGIGEASLSGRSLSVKEAIDRHLTPLLIGQDATRIEYLWQDIFRGTFWRGGPVLQSALAGIDIALWDVNAKALGVPLHRMLGGKARDRVLVYRHVYAPEPAELVQRSRALLDEGWTVLRISLGDEQGSVYDMSRAIRRGIQNYAALREAFGDEPEIMIDVHTRLTPVRAIEFCNAVAPYRPFMVEDPIRSENPASFRLLRQHTSVPIGTGEQLHHKWALRELIEEELVDYLRVDLCHTGGITEGRKIAAMGEAHYQELATHHTGSTIATLAALHLNTAIPNCAVQEYGPPPNWLNELFSPAPRTEDGFLIPPETPGLGCEFNEEAAQRAPYGDGEPPHLRRADGSVHDW